MVIENKIISVLSCSDLEKESLVIRNSFIGKIDLAFTGFKTLSLTITGCAIGELFLHTTWFYQGFILENCTIQKSLDFQMGGHNKKPVIIKNNVFGDFVNFDDCQFDELLIVENNIFCKATNLLIDFHTNESNTFAKTSRINNNIGDLGYNKQYYNAIEGGDMKWK